MVEKFFQNSNFSDFLGIKSEINQCVGAQNVKVKVHSILTNKLLDPCVATTQEASLIQYGKYKYAKTLSDMSGKPVDQIQSGVIYLAETRESQEMFS